MLRSVGRPALAKHIRYFTNSTVRCDTKPSTPSATPPSIADPKDASNNLVVLGSQMHRVSGFDQWLLVWVKRYKTKEEVPIHVTKECIDKARSRGRIRLANLMIAATLVGCIIAVTSGKRAAERGESVAKMNLDWHQKINEQYQATLASEADKKD